MVIIRLIIQIINIHMIELIIITIDVDMIIIINEIDVDMIKLIINVMHMDMIKVIINNKLEFVTFLAYQKNFYKDISRRNTLLVNRHTKKIQYCQHLKYKPVLFNHLEK